MRRAKIKKLYTIDGKTYNSKQLYDYHNELNKCKQSGLIGSFSLPGVGEISKSKFHSIKAVINNIQFDSLNESRYYIEVLNGIKNKKIKSYELQKPYELIPAYTKNGHKIRKMEYLADFVLKMTDGSTKVVDVKGVETDVFKLKKKLFEYKYPDLSIECVRYINSLSCWMTLKEYKDFKKQNRKNSA